MKKNKLKIGIIIVVLLFFTITPISVVNAAKNNNPMLKNIKIKGYNMEPIFEMFTTEYLVTVGENVEKIEIEATPDDKNATVKVEGNTNLKLGRNKIEIKVTAENGQAKQSYFIYVTKGEDKKANANLKEIKIKNVELAPAFDKNVINYAFEYPESLEQLEIEAVPEDEETKVEIIGNEKLKEVTQTIQIKVTAKDGQTIKNYYLIAKKADKEVENPEGNEPTVGESNEQLNEQKERKSQKGNVIFYSMIGIVAIVVFAILIKRGLKSKNEK
ncbi:MAG: cadherin-like beta sandwich domain-containing protein [Clostridia bacterium]|nr:cadherin-like beta sandwich domain-containing protein [Clostridia bacterium]